LKSTAGISGCPTGKAAVVNPQRAENEQIVRAAGVVGSATFLSRILGYVRDAVIAWLFGVSASADAFFVAFRIPNLLRRMFAEGSLSVAFVPVFTETLQQKGKAEALELARAALLFSSILLTGIVTLGVMFSPLIVRVVGPGFCDDPALFKLTVHLTRIMFPYILFIGLVAVSMGILNVFGHFAAPALAPVVLNLSIIGAALVISPRLEQPVLGLAVGVMAGGVLQLLLQIPFLYRFGIGFSRRLVFFHSGMKKMGKLMLPAVFGAAVYQINLLINTQLATLLPQGSVSYLYYADRLVQFPLGIVGIAAATALLPSLSRQAQAGDLPAVKQTFEYSVKLVMFITIPAMFGLIFLRDPIVFILFKRGAFDIDAVRLTADALLYYACGLWAFTMARLAAQTFYALEDTRTPARIAAVSIVVNIACGLTLMQFMGHAGLALATTIAAVVNVALLFWAMRAKLGPLGMTGICLSAGKAVGCSLVMCAGLILLRPRIGGEETQAVFSMTAGLGLALVAGLMLYFALAVLVRSDELKALIKIIESRKKA
jgi:putative peptidoglycan lipid II flippase